MSNQNKKGGQVGRIWRRHGGGFYALIAVGTFVYLEINALTSSIATAGSVQEFLTSEIVTMGIEMIMNTALATVWPIYWVTQFGWMSLAWAMGGYLVWTFLLAIALNRRQEDLRKELGL